MKNTIIIVLGIISIFFATLCYIQHEEINGNKDIIQDLEQTVDRVPAFESAITRLKTDQDRLDKENEQLKQQIKNHEDIISDLRSKVPDEAKGSGTEIADNNSKEEEKGSKNFMTGVADMLNNPEMRDAIRTQIKAAQINPIYGSLISKLNLSSDKTEELMDLIADRFLAGTDSIKALNNNNSKDAFKKTMEGIKIKKDEINSQIKELLGEEQYDEYKKYSDTEGERMFTSQFNQQLSFSSIPTLSQSQNDELVDIIKEETEASKKNPNYVNIEETSPLQFDDDTISDVIFQQVDINTRVKNRAEKVLSDVQLKKLEDYQNSYIKQIETGLKISSQMFGKKKPRATK